MTEPDKICLVDTSDGIKPFWGGVPDSWEHVEYIRKDALLEWAKAEIELSKQVELVSEGPYEEGRQQVARLLINYLNSM